MTFRPSSNSKKEIILSVSMAFLAMLLIVISGITNRFGGLYQITAIIFGVIAIEFYLKYVGSDYIYEAGEDSFKVYKVTGKKSICVSSLDYEMSLSYVVTSEEYLKNKQQFPVSNFNVNLCKNLAPNVYSVYFFEFNGKISMMKFEPDAVFSEYINNKIAAAFERKQDIEDY